MPNVQTVVLSMSLASYLMSFVLYIINFFKSNSNISLVARIFVIIAFLSTTAAGISRTINVGHLPFSNMFEFGLCFLWGMVLAFLVVDFKYNLKGLGMFFTPVAAAMLMWLVSLDQSSSPLMPALRSNWLYIHVFTAIIAYGAFGVSYVLGIMYLLKEQGFLKKTLPSLDLIDTLIYKIISFAMPFMTLLIITGAIWAEDAWGNYWSWDPKETWSLITWLIYAGYLHTRLMGKWKGRRSVIFAIVGFLAVMFTFVGVSYLLPGLHSYA
ncbi:MAG: c-type cytochrome biogenesis protein CcsB [Firmicutes bacterium]|nr:c-type cytochrome biogenesis protein CcsB [Bacillota bacterium]